jgi:hypothetical protein
VPQRPEVFLSLGQRDKGSVARYAIRFPSGDQVKAEIEVSCRLMRWALWHCESAW